MTHTPLKLTKKPLKMGRIPKRNSSSKRWLLGANSLLVSRRVTGLLRTCLHFREGAPNNGVSRSSDWIGWLDDLWFRQRGCRWLVGTMLGRCERWESTGVVFSEKKWFQKIWERSFFSERVGRVGHTCICCLLKFIAAKRSKRLQEAWDQGVLIGTILVGGHLICDSSSFDCTAGQKSKSLCSASRWLCWLAWLWVPDTKSQGRSARSNLAF